MKQLLYIIFIISSFTGFAQEKGPICTSTFGLSHYVGTADYDDYLIISQGHVHIKGMFYIDSTVTDSTIYEIVLPAYDSLTYSGSWVNDGWGACFTYMLETDETDSVAMVLSGPVFPITYNSNNSNGLYVFNIQQNGVIHDPCLIQLQAPYPNHVYPNPCPKYFVRVKFQDPPEPEVPLNIKEVTNDISLWLSNENTLTVKADKDAIWKMDLYSLSGQVIQKNQLEGSQDLDISSLSKGCYIARITNNTGIEKSLKFIK